MSAILALETGDVFHGTSLGVVGTRVGEVIFNTSMTGYQEIITDPSYKNQIITFTYSHIGNTGINYEDMQSSQIHAAGIVINHISKFYSNWRAKISLQEFLKQQQCVAIADIDTRRLTKIIRKYGSLRACIIADTELPDVEHALAQAQEYKIKGNLADEVSVTAVKKVNPTGFYNVALIDYGVKHGIIDCLQALNCKVTILPSNFTESQILGLHPDGIVLSNGPGDPAACINAISNVRGFLKIGIPMLGICLGHQLLSLALGARTYKMTFGHHGANHPVQDLDTKRVYITSQNHNYAVVADSLPSEYRVTHVSLFDQSIQGLAHISKPIYGFQGHPEAAPGPQEGIEIFNNFINAMKVYRAKEN